MTVIWTVITHNNYENIKKMRKIILFFLLAELFVLPVFAKEIPAELLTRTLQKRGSELLGSWDSVLKMQKDGKTVIFIDIRPETEFKKFHISHSINIPIFAIKTKNFLKAAELILINEGYNYSQLKQECINLRNAGFKAWIFNGGLNYWRQKVDTLIGNAVDQEDLNKIPPEAFFLERDYEGWILINADDIKAQIADNLIPKAINIPFNPIWEIPGFPLEDERGFLQGGRGPRPLVRGPTKTETQFLPQFIKEVGKHSNNPAPFILIFNKNGRQYKKIEEAIKKTGIANVFYLKGGLDGYRIYLENKIVNPQTRTSITAIGPANTKIINKPCGACQ